ncbi:hypothetical protein PHLGIDRAFT_70994 [Phlebiopsis gigantea 11061_1 CR5-6]|uniref:RNA helicase n=1 Tax=Phlebiopsis gigantea (strain 11061_1 CR5-6) TaxID=745531 RepID=A0A0C3NQP4_PHLG1|nr:hypothetical protein PHLGIDRAFT_70994 [Phlebiopsis gigantea 11061_1 CR5-6]
MDLSFTPERIARIAHDLSKGEADVAPTLTSLFYEWATHASTHAELSKVVSASAIASISALFRAADLLDPGAKFALTRTAPRRKVIMHVGPTNSGKTHNALRALAAAEFGMYAGPLRLLAHEIFDRLNKGQIVPLGQDPDADAEADEDTNIDAAPAGEKPAIQKHGNKRYARACNLITGEEQRIVDENAGLMSCTVEMTPSITEFDVAVIDEIQMIADPERGGAWSQAVLALNAKEIHLCGEETAVPLIRALLRDTGDEVIVNRYERLSPLQCANASLKGDYSKAEKGDCFVCFSRSGIFKTKQKVEKITGMKCAVAYGRLPPEIRTEQAALFNDPNSGYDLMVGSDAIGMGLNLKIKRIVFDTTSKWSGSSMQPLSLSSIKQIAGRAGRFGLHGADSSGGIAATLYDEDLEVVRDALASTPAPLKFASYSPAFEEVEAVAQVLPPGTPISTVYQVFSYVSRVHPCFELQDPKTSVTASESIEKTGAPLTLADRHLLQQAPIPWRDPLAVMVMLRLVRMYGEDMYVDYARLLHDCGMQQELDNVKKLIQKGARSPPPGTLENLETMHKITTLYLWLSYRKPVSFNQREEVLAVKGEVEKAMDWCLEYGAGSNFKKLTYRSFNNKPARKDGKKPLNPAAKPVRTVLRKHSQLAA